jgi:hypothetical protein
MSVLAKSFDSAGERHEVKMGPSLASEAGGHLAEIEVDTMMLPCTRLNYSSCKGRRDRYNRLKLPRKRSI